MDGSSAQWRYLVVVLLVSYLSQLALWIAGDNQLRFVPLVMLGPAAVAVAFRLKRREGFRNVGWGFTRWWYVVPAVVVPLAVIAACGVALTAFGFASWSGKPFLLQDGVVRIKGVRLLLGIQPQAVPLFALNLVLTFGVQSVLGGMLTFGEEFGWRGYLQEKLIRRFGLTVGLLLLGVFWGYWHLPMVLMGWSFPNRPVLGALVLMPISTVCLGMYVGWIYLRARSIWMPTIAHAAANLSWPLLASEMALPQGQMPLQVAWMAAWGIVGLACWWALQRRPPVLWQGPAAAAGT